MNIYDLSIYIQEHDIDDIMKLLSDISKTIKQKILLMLSLYCQCYISSNIWLLYKIHTLIYRIEEENHSKKENDEYIKQMCLYFKYSDIKQTIIDLEVNNDDIHKILMIQSEFLIDQEKINILTQHTISLLNVFYVSLLYGHTSKAILIVKYILNKSNKELFLKNHKGDIIWMIFDMLLNIPHLPVNCKDYIGICKDIFFYKLGKNINERNERLTLLFYSIFVASSMKVKNKKVLLPIDMNNIEDRMSYLFIYTSRDDSINSLLEKCKNEKKKESKLYSHHKPVNVNDKEYEKLERLKEQTNIIRV